MNIEHPRSRVHIVKTDNQVEGDFLDFVEICDKVFHSGLPNFAGCKILIPTTLNLAEWEIQLADYEDNSLIDYLKYGWPLGHEGEVWPGNNTKVRNHKGAIEYPAEIEQYLENELKEGRIMGPFQSSPFQGPLKVSPLNTVEKKGSLDRRVILDLSYPENFSVNEGISKEFFLGEKITLKYPSVDDLCKIICQKGQGCLLFKRDLSKAYRQIRVDPGDVRKLGFQWQNNLYTDCVISMGVRSGAFICQRTTSAVAHEQVYGVLQFLLRPKQQNSKFSN